MRRRSQPEPVVRTAEWEAAYREHLPTVVRYLARRLGEDVAQDASADVFVRALRAHERGEGPITLPWLYGVAANVIRERRRSERRRLRAIERLAALERTSSPPSITVGWELDPALITVLRKLNDGDREVLLLVAWGDLSYQEVADALQIPIGTVRSRMARAREHLQPATRADPTPTTRTFNA